MKKSNLLLLTFKSLIFLTWCISTFSSPHMTHVRPRLVDVNFAFHVLCRLARVGPALSFVLARFPMSRSWGLRIDILNFWSFFCMWHPRSGPNIRKVLLSVLVLNFLVKVRAQDSVISQMIHSRCFRFPTKS